MGRTRTDEFRKDAVRIALARGLTRRQVADDLGVGLSTLNTWITAHRGTDVVSKEESSLAQETDRRRRENRILKEERAISKKASVFFARHGALKMAIAFRSPPKGCTHHTDRGRQ